MSTSRCRSSCANALEAAYRTGHADTGVLFEAERVRAEAKTELAILGVETGATVVGVGAIAKGLRAAKIADKLDDATPLAAAMAASRRTRDATDASDELIADPARTRQISNGDIQDRVDTKVARRTPGTATGQGQPVDNDWIRSGIHNSSGSPIPDTVAKSLNGREFRSFDQLREVVWKEVSQDPDLASQFSTVNQARAATGKAPFAPMSQQVGGRRNFELDHITEIVDGGKVYDFDNLQIMTPRNHIEKTIGAAAARR